MAQFVKEEIARKYKNNESVYKHNTLEDVVYGRSGKSLQKKLKAKLVKVAEENKHPVN